MIERKIVGDRFDEFAISNFIRKTISDVPIKNVDYEKTPLGERVTIHTSAPGLVIGREGSNIKRLTEALKKEFKLENPQIKIGEIKNQYLSSAVVAKIIANNLSNFGPQKFKLTAFKAISGIMDAGAMGVEIRLTGKIPSSRAKSWRFAKGYLKKTGYISDYVVDRAVEHVTLKTGVIGIRVMIMLPDTPLPDKIVYHDLEKAQITAEDEKKELLKQEMDDVVVEEEDIVEEVKEK